MTGERRLDDSKEPTIRLGWALSVFHDSRLKVEVAPRVGFILFSVMLG
jgi:hypothetical protein